MSLKQDNLVHMSVRDAATFRGKHHTSDNECYRPASDSDYSSDLDSLWRDRLAVGATVLARFVAKFTTDGDCWIWQASTVRGYGQFTYAVAGPRRQRHVYAHRFAYESAFGSLPSSDIKVCHRCDTPRCVRPSHLFAGPQALNLADACAKGRLVPGRHCRTLSDAAYFAILTAPRTRGMGRALARRFGVSRVSISRIWHGRQGVTYQRTRTLERVPARLVPVVGEVRL